jgi:hypothetical protein
VYIPRVIYIGLILGLLAHANASFAQNNNDKKAPPPLSVAAGGRLVYVADSLGNRIPDFSYCGYYGGDRAIPMAPVRVVVPVRLGDATTIIQAALDYVAGLPADAAGIRGAVLLQKGTYRVEGSLLIKASGVVLRGSGMGKKGTVLFGAGKDRLTLIRVMGADDQQLSAAETITDNYVPVNANTINVNAGDKFKVGDRVVVRRPSTAAWIKNLGADHFGGGITALGWKPGQRDLYWDRAIVAVHGNTLVLDAPLTTALDKQYGGGTAATYRWAGRISQVGIENLRCVSEYDGSNLKDEDHRWMAITMEHTTDAWVRQVIFEHFAGSAVYITETGSRITVEDCKSLAPVSEIGGERRNTFFTAGQQTLFQRLYAEQGIHDFVTGFCAAGPNVFIQCEAKEPYSFSGCLDSWAAGVLFDMVYIDGRPLSLMNRGQDGQGAGWSAANSVTWNCSAARIDCYQPPTAQNWSFGSWAQFSGDGYWNESNNTINPRSLYYAQLAERLGGKAQGRMQLLLIETDATSSPTVAQAAALTALSVKPQRTVAEYIDEAPVRQPIVTMATGVKTTDELGLGHTWAGKIVPKEPLHVNNGWLVCNKKVQTGGRISVPWWSGSARTYALANARPAVTRFVPGRVGPGLTDDLEALTDTMTNKHQTVLEQNYGLWYDRRRDDHERIRRMDGDVWAPFYELPFARSGQGLAWDGLSKYDLTKYNYWYWNRLKQFAHLATQKGLVLVHQDYFQHNIIEAGAHYADFPWRPANNINNTGFPEPPPYAGDKRIFMAEQFYDVTHPVRRALHKAYIRQCLNNFPANSAVIQLIGEEFTGPLHFVQFWIDVINEWEKETGTKVLIGLATTKDVQDAILADPERAAVIDLIDIRYWHYQQDGKAYAPAGGENLTPRQHARLLKPVKSSFEQVYRAVTEYRSKYPGKAVSYSGDNYPAFAWAAFMAGGSLAAIPRMPPAFLTDAAGMQPVPSGNTSQYSMKAANGGCIVYTTSGAAEIDLSTMEGNDTAQWINPHTGSLIGKPEKVKGGKAVMLKSSGGKEMVLWIRNEKQRKEDEAMLNAYPPKR